MFLLWLAFFCSGIVGLSYEITWVRYLNQLFGASTPAVAATVSIFFLGLALGAAIGGRVFDRQKHPLLAYAGLEAAIGLCAACVPLCFHFAEQWLIGHLHQGAEHPMMWLAVSTLILLLPTTLLGATFPAMASVVRHLDNPTHSTGFFYGFNTLGAVLGCLVVSFWLLPGVGQQDTTYIMAATNLLIAVMLVGVHLLIKRKSEMVRGLTPPFAQPSPVSEPEGARSHKSDLNAAIPSSLALLLAGVSGCLAIGIEVLWTRALALSFPASHYVFSLVLAAYLSGIGLGAVAVGAFFRKRPSRRAHLLALYCAIGVGSAATLLLFAQIGPWSQQILQWKADVSKEFYLGSIGVGAVLAMLPATLAMGAALPLLIGLSTSGEGDTSRTAGAIYAVNTIGGVLGSLLVTFGLLPWLGLSRSLFLLGVGYVGLAVLLALRTVQISAPLRRATCGLMVIGCLAVVGGWFPEANPRRHRVDANLLHYQEGSSATLAVYEHKRGHRELHINNYPLLISTRPEVVRMQYAVGHLSAILHPKPSRMLLIGFGAGTTLAAATQHGIPAVDCVVRHGQRGLASMFSKANHSRSWRRSTKTRTIFMSGESRRILLRKGPRYDVIASDLTLPGDPGLGSLYSVEQFRAARQRLTKQGVFVVWLPLSRFSASSVEVITKTFLTVFPKAEGWMMSRFSELPVLGLIGRRDDGMITPQLPLQAIWTRHFQRSWKRFRQIHTDQPRPRNANRVSVVPLQTLSTQQLRALAQDAQINRLERPASSLLLSLSSLQRSLKRSSSKTTVSYSKVHRRDAGLQ